MSTDADVVKAQLTELLNECLESANQENSFKVTNVNLDTMKFQVEFDIVDPEENGNFYFAGY